MIDKANLEPSGPVPNPVPVWRTRLRRRARLLVACGVVLVLLVLLSGVPPLAGSVAGVALVLIFALLDDKPFARVDGYGGMAARSHELPGLVAFADALLEPVIVIDKHGLVIHRNTPALEQFPSVSSGVPVTLSLRNPELVRAIESAAETGEGCTVELHETVPAETWARVAVSPLRFRDRDWALDEGRLLAITFQSLTELKRADAMRADFVANASHELRTPLASLLGFIETLQGPAARDAAARKRFLGIMRGQAERMSRLIEDLLSLSHIEMHQHMRPASEVDLLALVKEAAMGFEARAKEAGVELDVVIQMENAQVTGDAGQLFEVIENLLDNAFKYGGSGGRIEVRLEPAQRPQAVALSVTDFGPGVGEEHVPRLTERFYRSVAGHDRTVPGTGLGLAIVKHIVTRHRGHLSIRSRPGEGLKVLILLPR